MPVKASNAMDEKPPSSAAYEPHILAKAFSSSATHISFPLGFEKYGVTPSSCTGMRSSIVSVFQRWLRTSYSRMR